MSSNKQPGQLFNRHRPLHQIRSKARPGGGVPGATIPAARKTSRLTRRRENNRLLSVMVPSRSPKRLNPSRKNASPNSKTTIQSNTRNTRHKSETKTLYTAKQAPNSRKPAKIVNNWRSLAQHVLSNSIKTQKPLKNAEHLLSEHYDKS